MLKCEKCGGRVFIDRMYNAENHIETFCVICGQRKFYHNWHERDRKAQWLLEVEKARAKLTISQL
jgi:predicted  nucleic acid-binding Zn-ribbon protein